MASELQGLSLEEQERQKAEWSAELAKVGLGDTGKFRRRKIMKINSRSKKKYRL